MSQETTATEIPVREVVAGRVRMILGWHGLNATDLARMTGMSQRSVSRRLTGEAPFDVDELQLVADALEVDMRELLPARNREPGSAELATVTRLEPRTVSTAARRRRRPNNPSLGLTGRPPQRDDRAGTHPPNRGLRDSHTDESTRRPVIRHTPAMDSAA